MDKHAAGTATVIPVILEAVDWAGSPICQTAGLAYRGETHNELAKPRGGLDRCVHRRQKSDRSASHHPNLLAGSALHRLRLRSRLSLRDNEPELVLKARSQTGRLVSPRARIRKWGQIFTFVLDNDTAGTMARCSINRELRRRWKHFFLPEFLSTATGDLAFDLFGLLFADPGRHKPACTRSYPNIVTALFLTGIRLLDAPASISAGISEIRNISSPSFRPSWRSRC